MDVKKLYNSMIKVDCSNDETNKMVKQFTSIANNLMNNIPNITSGNYNFPLEPEKVRFDIIYI